MFVSDESSTAFGIIDTGTSLMYVPVDILNQFVGLWVTKLGSKLQCDAEGCTVLESCHSISDQFDDIIIQFGNEKYPFEPSDYLID